MPNTTHSLLVIERGPWSRELWDRTPTTGVVPDPVKAFVQVTARKHSLQEAIQDLNHLWNKGYIITVDNYAVTPRALNLAWPLMPLPQ